ncbi:MAG: SDR family oxidoreductase [Propionicimonas sp.]
MNRPVALVTGASRGIGHQIALELGSTHHVLVGGRDAAAVGKVVDLLPSAVPFVADVTDEAAIASLCATIGSLDVLVHSAGQVAFGPLAKSSTQQWRALLEVNVTAPATLTRMLLPALRAAHGLVVFLNSGAGLRAAAGFSAYSASKFALTALADALRAEEHGQVRVTSVHPGRVATDMQVELTALEDQPYRPAAYLDPTDVARAVRLAVDLAPGVSLETIRLN